MPKGFRMPSPDTGGIRVPSKSPGAKPKAKASASSGDAKRMGKAQPVPTGQRQTNRFPPSTGKIPVKQKPAEKTGKP